MQLHTDPAFDRLLLRSLSVTAVGAASATAIAGVGTQVAPGEVVSWERYWRREGDRALERADDRLAADDVSGAGRQLLSASWSYGQAAHFYRSDPASEMWQANRLSQISAFQAAIPLLPNGCEPIVMSTRVGNCHGYLIGEEQNAGAYVLIPVGVEMSAEDSYALFASTAEAVGARCLVIDLCMSDGTRAADADVMGTALTWLTGRSSKVFVLGWGALASRTVAAIGDHSGLAGVLCCPDAAEADAVCRLLPALECPSVLLPPDSEVAAGLRWLPSSVP